MDLSRYDTREKASAGVDVPLEIEGETVIGDDDQPVTFRLKGIHDPEVQACLLRGSRSGESRTPEEMLQGDMKLARAAVIGWSDNFTVHGEKVPYSKANIEKVFANPVVRRAVLAKVADEHRFMNGS